MGFFEQDRAKMINELAEPRGLGWLKLMVDGW